MMYRKHLEFIGYTGLRDSVGRAKRLFRKFNEDIYTEEVCYKIPKRKAGQVYLLKDGRFAIYNCSYTSYGRRTGRVYCYERALLTKEQFKKYCEEYDLRGFLEYLKELETGVRTD